MARIASLHGTCLDNRSVCGCAECLPVGGDVQSSDRRVFPHSQMTDFLTVQNLPVSQLTVLCKGHDLKTSIKISVRCEGVSEQVVYGWK